jgi:hypothetical protein
MGLYKVITQGTAQLSYEVQANSKKEAEEKVWSGEYGEWDVEDVVDEFLVEVIDERR